MNYRLRGHHLFNLVTCSDDNYRSLEDGLRCSTVRRGEINHKAYTADDASFSRTFYTEISSNPDNLIEIVAGIDDRCRRCSNYDGNQCTMFRSSDLEREDERSLSEAFPGLNRGDIVRVADVMRH